MNDWKLTSVPRATLSGWGYRESRYLPKEPGAIRRTLTATRGLLTLIVHTVSR